MSLGSTRERCRDSVSAACRMARWRLCIRDRNPSSHEPPPFHMGSLTRWIEVARYESDIDFRRSRCHGVPESGGSLDR
jgi:hypothetical protein